MPAYNMQGGFSGIYTVKEVAPQTPPSVTGLQSSAERRFKLPCQWAQDFGLRALGKLYEQGTYDLPELPVDYPLSTYGVTGWDESYPQRLKLRAVGFRVESPSDYCFNNDIYNRSTEEPEPAVIEEIRSPFTLARHWKMSDTLGPESLPVAISDNCCECVVSIQYEEQWWHCLWSDAVNREGAPSWLGETAFKVDRVSSYELYTRPSRPLIWEGETGTNQRLGPDSHAVTIIPSTEITVEWHNIPVSKLCELEGHLNQYRQTVNCSEVTFFRHCNCAQTSAYNVTCDEEPENCQYEADTLLFVDYAEDKNRRTAQFGPMDTTTLVLTFKHKRIRTGLDEIVGHNHLLYDKTTSNEDDDWKKVHVQMGTGNVDLFAGKDFNKLFSYEDAADCPAEEP